MVLRWDFVCARTLPMGYVLSSRVTAFGPDWPKFNFSSSEQKILFNVLWAINVFICDWRDPYSFIRDVVWTKGHLGIWIQHNVCYSWCPSTNLLPCLPCTQTLGWISGRSIQNSGGDNWNNGVFLGVHEPAHLAFLSLSWDGVFRWASDLEHGRWVEMRASGKLWEALFLCSSWKDWHYHNQGDCL